MPLAMRPQLLTQAMNPPTGDWQYEIKYDGYRFLARVGEQVRLFTKNGHDWTAKLPVLAAELGRVPGCAWLDGEVVALNESGQPSFHDVQQAFALGNTGHLVFYVFDLMYLNHADLRQEPLENRRALLADLIGDFDSDFVRFSENLEADPKALLDVACGMKLEGIVAKRCGSRYSEKRSSDWVKVKCNNHETYRVAGYIRAGTSIGAIIIGTFNEDGFVYSGRIQAGLTDRLAGRIFERASGLHSNECPFAMVPSSLKNQEVVWMRPVLECRVKLTEVTPSGRVRHGVLISIEARRLD